MRVSESLFCLPNSFGALLLKFPYRLYFFGALKTSASGNKSVMKLPVLVTRTLVERRFPHDDDDDEDGPGGSSGQGKSLIVSFLSSSRNFYLLVLLQASGMVVVYRCSCS